MNVVYIVLFILVLFQVGVTQAKSCSKGSPLEIENRAINYKNSIDTYSKKYNVDKELVKAVITAESCFRRTAVSHKGAVGLMQLMPAAAKRWKVSDRLDADQNIRGGTRYLSFLMKRFENNIQLALAGYHAGEGNVDKYNGIPPFKSTRKYIRNVVSVYAKLQLEKSSDVELNNKIDKDTGLKIIKVDKMPNDKSKLENYSKIEQESSEKITLELENKVINKQYPLAIDKSNYGSKLGTRFQGMGTRYNSIGLRY